MRKAPIHKIIHHSLVDGPGNRSSIFLQGCNLKCEFCHNPETIQIYSENNSPAEIKWMTAEEVFNEVKVNIPFIRGISVSGGECALFPGFLEDLFVLAQKAGLSCLIDSNGTIDFSLFPGLMKNCNGVMLDIKAWDMNVFKNLTGGSNEIVKKNLKFLFTEDKLEEIRIVCIPDEGDVLNILEGIKDIIGDGISNIRLKLIKFRNQGVVGRLKDTNSPSNEYMNSLKNTALELGFRYISK